MTNQMLSKPTETFLGILMCRSLVVKSVRNLFLQKKQKKIQKVFIQNKLKRVKAFIQKAPAKIYICKFYVHLSSSSTDRNRIIIEMVLSSANNFQQILLPQKSFLSNQKPRLEFINSFFFLFSFFSRFLRIIR